MRALVFSVSKEFAKLLSGEAFLPDGGNYGQALLEEREDAGSLQCAAGFYLEGDWEQHTEETFGSHELFGGAQYFRALDEFRWLLIFC